MLTQILNGRILTPQGWIRGGSVIIDGNKIIEVSNNELHIESARFFDAAGCHIVPGGIDIHVHGGGGRDFMEGTEEAFRKSHKRTHVLWHHIHSSTLSSSTVPMIKAAVRTTEKLMAQPDSPFSDFTSKVRISIRKWREDNYPKHKRSHTHGLSSPARLDKQH